MALGAAREQGTLCRAVGSSAGVQCAHKSCSVAAAGGTVAAKASGTGTHCAPGALQMLSRTPGEAQRC